MCEVIGIKYEDVDFEEPKWFSASTWTMKQEDEFVKWLGKYLRKNKYVRMKKYRGQDAGEYAARKIVFNYGWSYDEKSLEEYSTKKN